MINWFDMPAEGLSNGGQFEVKELEVTENGTYEEKGEMYNKVTVNVEGGGSSWQTVFEGSVTTKAQQIGEPTGKIEGVSEITADTIKVTFNGTEYTCEKVDDGYGDSTFTEYPFFIDSWNGKTYLHTKTAGAYTLKIEEPQSGGSSDFSTANVTLTIGAVTQGSIEGVCLRERGGISQMVTNYPLQPNATTVIPAVLYKGQSRIHTQFSATIAVEGNIQQMGNNNYMITGDCAITIS